MEGGKKEKMLIQTNYEKYPVAVEEMRTIRVDDEAGADINSGNLVILTERNYRALTEDGVVKMIEDGIYHDFDKASDPADLIRFVRWQLDKLPWNTAKRLWDYIYWGLKREKTDHPHKALWEEFCDVLKEYVDAQQASYDARQTIERVFPAEGNRVYCLCRDGNFRIYDATWAVENGKGAFESFKEPSFFHSHIGVMNDTLAWDRSGDQSPYDCIDICPSEIYDSKCLKMDKMIAIVDAVLNGRPVPEELLQW